MTLSGKNIFESCWDDTECGCISFDAQFSKAGPVDEVRAYIEHHPYRWFQCHVYRGDQDPITLPDVQRLA